jgi:hypothetical protein
MIKFRYVLKSVVVFMIILVFFATGNLIASQEQTNVKVIREDNTHFQASYTLNSPGGTCIENWRLSKWHKRPNGRWLWKYVDGRMSSFPMKQYETKSTAFNLSTDKLQEDEKYRVSIFIEMDYGDRQEQLAAGEHTFVWHEMSP